MLRACLLFLFAVGPRAGLSSKSVALVEVTAGGGLVRRNSDPSPLSPVGLKPPSQFTRSASGAGIIRPKAGEGSAEAPAAQIRADRLPSLSMRSAGHPAGETDAVKPASVGADTVDASSVSVDMVGGSTRFLCGQSCRNVISGGAPCDAFYGSGCKGLPPLGFTVDSSLWELCPIACGEKAADEGFTHILVILCICIAPCVLAALAACVTGILYPKACRQVFGGWQQRFIAWRDGLAYDPREYEDWDDEEDCEEEDEQPQEDQYEEGDISTAVYDGEASQSQFNDGSQSQFYDADGSQSYVDGATMMPSGTTMMEGATTMMPSSATMMEGDATMMPSSATMMEGDATMMPSSTTMMDDSGGATMMMGSTMMMDDTQMLGSSVTMVQEPTAMFLSTNSL